MRNNLNEHEKTILDVRFSSSENVIWRPPHPTVQLSLVHIHLSPPPVPSEKGGLSRKRNIQDTEGPRRRNNYLYNL